MEKKRKILFRIRSMEMGGVQRVLVDILKNLDLSKFEVAVLYNIRQGVLLNEVPKNIPQYTLTKGREEMSKNPIFQKIQLAFRLAQLKLYKAFPILTKNKIPFTPDVEVAMFHPNYQEVLDSPFKNSKKICWVHAEYEQEEFLEPLSKCDTAVYVSHKTMLGNIKNSQGKIKEGVVIHNAFDIEKIRTLALEPIDFNFKAPSFVSVGRLAGQKGYDILIEAHKKLIDKCITHYIYIIGGGPDKAQLQTMIDSKDLSDTCFLLGQIQNPFPYIAQADYYIQPSRFEAYPLTIGEAQILGKAIISTDVGGVCEMIKDNEDGLICEVNAEDIAKKMQYLLEHPHLKNDFETQIKKRDFEKKNRDIYKSLEDLFLSY